MTAITDYLLCCFTKRLRDSDVQISNVVTLHVDGGDSSNSDIADSDPFKEALVKYRRELSQNEQNSIFPVKVQTRDAMIAESNVLRAFYQNSVPGFYTAISSIFEKILGFSNIIDVFSQVVSNPGCIIWGSVKLILEMTWRSTQAIEAAVSSLKIATDQIPFIDALTNLFPKDVLLRQSIVKVYVEMIGQCCDCIVVFRRNWAGNLVKLPFASIKAKSTTRASRIRDLVAQSNWAGLIAYYNESRERERSCEHTSSQRITERKKGRLISAQVSNKYLIISGYIGLINEHFKTAGKAKRQGTFAIHGMGGVGKTSLAAYYAHLSETEEAYPITVWLQANAKATLDSSVVEATRMLDLAKDSDTSEQCLRTLLDFLRKEKEIPWLVIFDNVDDFELLKKYWPIVNHGAVLLTSRDSPAALNRCTTGLELKGLDEKQSKTLLSMYVPKELIDDPLLVTDLIWKRMGGLPMGISLAGGYMSDYQVPLKTYLEMLSHPDDAKKLYDYKPRGDPASYEFTMATQWLITKEKLEDTGKDLALSLIGIMVFFHNVNIPESVFALKGYIPEKFYTLKELAKQGELLEASSSLLRQSLISKDSEKKTLTIHPLMHTTIFEAMSHQEKQESYENAAYLLYQSFPGKAKDGEDMKMRWNLCNTYFPHVLQHLERADEGKVVKSEYSAQMIMHTVRYAWEIGQFGQVNSLLAKCRQACQEIKTIDTGLTEAEALHFAGWLNAKMGKLAPAKTPQEAVAMTKQALELRLERLPKDDPIIGGAYGNLAMFTIATAEYEDSLKYSQDCLDIRMLNESNETNNISVTHNYFGWCYAKMGDNERSNGDTLKASGKAEDADICYRKANNYYSKAEISFKEGINVITRNLGERARKGPQMIWPMYALGNLYLSLGRENDAYQLHSDAHELGISLYGAISPRVFIWQFKMAWYDYHRGNMALARQKAETLLDEMTRQGFYIGHIARTQYFLSLILEAQTDLPESHKFREKAIKIAEDLNGAGWKSTKGEQDFDDLVFFHDR